MESVDEPIPVGVGVRVKVGKFRYVDGIVALLNEEVRCLVL